jgi:hypothetical protein
VDPGADDHAALGERAQCNGDERADRSENNGPVELLGRRFVRPTRPLGTKVARKALTLLIARSRERVHAPPLMARDLRDDVRRGAEAVQPEPFGFPSQAKRAIADEAGAQKRCRFDV